MKAAILVFPGSNCEEDLKEILTQFYNFSVDYIWYSESFSDQYDICFLPGGFSYGDYLRSGALAKISTSISSLKEIIQKGKIVIGICNGFQILTEAKILPGSLIKNKNLRHICKWVHLKSPNNSDVSFPEDFTLPVSHSEGNYICDPKEMDHLLEKDQILLQYKENLNGSMHNIAGITDVQKKVIGLMPHPERAFYQSRDIPQSHYQYGKIFFDTIFNSFSIL